MKKRLISFLDFTLLLLGIVLTSQARAQPPSSEKEFLGQLSMTGGLPTDLLSSRTAVLHSHIIPDKELALIQEYFQNVGIDAVAYYPLDMVLAGRDVTKNFSAQLLKREIGHLAIAEKDSTGYRIILTKFNGKDELVDKGQIAWLAQHADLKEALKSLFREASASGLKRSNLLVNGTPETGATPDPIPGKRNDFYAVDMKVDMVAIPKFGDEEMDRQLEEILQANFPFKYTLTEPGVSEKDLRKQGMLYILCFVNARAKVARELLGYNTGKSESAVVSVTYPDGPQPQLRSIPANTRVYKAYFKHIDSGNVFLGTKWDGDVTWQKALLNQIRGMKAELRLN